MTETILLTGATGYIASHTWVELLDAGYQVIGLDNLCNSSSTVLSRIEQITAKTPKFVQGDVRDRRLLDDLFASSRISAVIHFAALKSVGESVQKPLAYYDNNMGGLVTLCAAMAHANVRQLVSARRQRCMAIRTPCRSPNRFRCRPPTRMARPR